MALEFTTAQDVEEVLRARPRGRCQLCGVAATPTLPLLRLWDDGRVVFDGCVGCLHGKVDGVPEATALVRAAMLMVRAQLDGSRDLEGTVA